MSVFRRYVSFLLWLPLSAFLLAGCAPSKPESARTFEAADPSRPPVYSPADYKSPGPGKSGGTLRVSVTSDTLSLDLHTISATNAQWLGRILYDNLVYLDDKGHITPWLAKSWTISEDGKTYTFHLRNDVTFSDGSRFDAEAVRVNLEHMRDPATRSPLAAAYIAPYVNGEVVDDFTFRAHLSEPYAPFLDVLAQSWLCMQSAKAIKENPKALGSAPVGSGPFVVESYTRQQGIRFVRRADYHWAPDFINHKGPAYLDRIEVDFIAESLVRYYSLAAGQYDFTIDAPPANAAAIRADSNLVFDSRIRQGNPSRAITFNTGKFPFDDLQVRKAMALAIDREGILPIVGFGEYAPKTDFLAANTRYYDPSFQAALKFDLPTANKLLDADGWTQRDADGVRTKDGKRLASEVLATEAATPAVIVAVQSDLKKIGFELKITQLPLGQVTERRNKNDYQAVAGGVWHTNTPDGLYILYHTNEITSEKRIGQNTSRISDAELDDVLSRARRSTDSAERAKLYSAAQRRLTELVPAVPMFENYSLTARRKNVRGVTYDTSHNTPVFTTFWLER